MAAPPPPRSAPTTGVAAAGSRRRAGGTGRAGLPKAVAKTGVMAAGPRRQGGRLGRAGLPAAGVMGRGSPPASAPASSAVEISRMRYFWTLPVTVIGNPSTIFQCRGIL